MKNTRRNFANDDQGAVALIVGVALVFIIFGILSSVIELNRTQTSYSKNQDATDAAALATSEFILKGIIDQIGKNPDPFNWKPTDIEIKNYAENILKQNFQVSQSSAIYDPTSLQVNYTKTSSASGLGNDYKITVRACANLDTKIAKVANNTSSTKTCTESKAGFSLTGDKKVEVALALDYTSSMYCKGAVNCVSSNASARETFANSKAAKLDQTMRYIFDNYFADEGETPRLIYASIVPFTSMVNIYPYNNNFVTPQTAAPNINPKSFVNLPYLVDYQFKPDFTAGAPITDYISFDQAYSYVFDRMPAIESAAKFNDIINSTDANNFMPMQSFRATYNNLDQGGTYNNSFCFNNAVYGGLDQRIEKEYFDLGRDVGKQIQADGSIKIPSIDLDGSKKTKPLTLLRESFPVQPLTNQGKILKETLARFTANGNGERLFPTQSHLGTVIDSQSSRLNKTRAFTDSFGTSSVHGLLWAWLTISNDLEGEWAAKSIHENYIGGSVGNISQTSRNNLPSNENVKHLILITDGNDNDGDVVGGFTNACDAYSPKAKLSTNQYLGLCNRIKRDDITVHTILFDFTPPTTGVNKYQSCASAGEYYENVSPANLQSVMDKIFKDILADLVTVKLVE